MMKKSSVFIVLSALALLTGCVSRQQADERLARGCAAGVEAFLADTYKIKEIKDKIFSKSEEEGNGFRDVTLKYVESDGWADVDKEARCTFAEEFGLFGMTHTANIYQVSVNGQVYGKKGGEIIGGYDEILKLTEKVDRAMNDY